MHSDKEKERNISLIFRPQDVNKVRVNAWTVSGLTSREHAQTLFAALSALCFSGGLADSFNN